MPQPFDFQFRLMPDGISGVPRLPGFVDVVYSGRKEVESGDIQALGVAAQHIKNRTKACGRYMPVQQVKVRQKLFIRRYVGRAKPPLAAHVIDITVIHAQQLAVLLMPCRAYRFGIGAFRHAQAYPIPLQNLYILADAGTEEGIKHVRPEPGLQKQFVIVDSDYHVVRINIALLVFQGAGAAADNGDRLILEEIDYVLLVAEVSLLPL